MAELEALKTAGEDVALVLAAQSFAGMAGSELLGQVRELHAHAQRGLLIEWGSWGDGRTAEEIFEAMARRQIEYYVIRPSQTPDELFHQSISDLSARVGTCPAGLAAHRPRHRRLLDRQGPGTERGPGALRGAARVLSRRLPGRPGAGHGDGGRKAAAARRLPQRDGSDRPDQPGAGDCRRRHHRPQPARLRRGHRRRRAGRPFGGGLRCLRGLADAGR